MAGMNRKYRLLVVVLWGILWMSSLTGQDADILRNNAPLCVALPDISLSHSYCEDFETMGLGEISPQGNPEWTLFGGAPFDQAFVVTAPPSGQGQTLMFSTYSDVDLNLARLIQTNTRLEWKIYIPAGKSGDWGLETWNPFIYDLDVKYHQGIATIYESLSKVGELSYPSDQWFSVVLVFSPKEDRIELWMEGQLVWTVENYESHLITDVNFYWANFGGENEFYIDDIRYYEVSEDCGQDPFGGPVCVNQVIYSSTSEALCAGYTDQEWTEGDCLTAMEVFSSSNVLRVYPNPARNTSHVVVEFSVNESEGQLEMYSARGERIYGTDWRVEGSAGLMKLNADIGSWSPGVYLVCISTNGGRFQEKLVVIGN